MQTFRIILAHKTTSNSKREESIYAFNAPASVDLEPEDSIRKYCTIFVLG